MTTVPAYPEDDLNKGKRLLTLLGSFWSEIFDDRDRLQTHLQSSAHEQGQTHLNFLETVACVSRFTVPVFHREDWHLIVLKRSDVENTASVYQAGDLVYGPQTGSVSGRPAGFIQTYGGRDRLDVVKVPLTSPMVDIPITLQNLVVTPSLVLVKGTDYDIEVREAGRVIVFREDPFINPLVPSRQVVDSNGTVIDTEIAFWAYGGQFDLQYVYVQFGYVLGLQLKSTQFYKDIINAWWNQFLEGFSVKHLQSFLSALSGAPIALGPEETVEVVRDEGDSKLVVTNLYTYRIPAGATVTVAVGDVLHAGDVLSDAFQIVEIGGANPDFSLLPAASFGKNFLSGGYFSEMFFRNTKVAVQYGGLDSDGRAIVTFEVNGFPGDVEAFWDAAQERGKASGQTLANLLDVRPNPVGEPTPASLPAEINPLEFLLENLLKNNLFLMRVKQSSFDPDAPGAQLFRCLRVTIPPHTSYIVLLEFTVPSETVDLSQPGDENEPGAEDGVGGFFAANPILDEGYEESSAPPGDSFRYGEIVSARLVSGVCQ